jgi:hypothetical protein
MSKKAAMANSINTDPAASVSAALPVAAPAVAPGQVTGSVAGAPVLTPYAVLLTPPSVSVEISPAAQFLATVAQSQDQLSQLQATAIDSVALQSAVDTLTAQQVLPAVQAADENPALPASLASLTLTTAEDPAQQINTNPALAAAIAAYRMQEQPNARPVLPKKGLINPIPALNGEEALESETDPSVLSEQQQNRQG